MKSTIQTILVPTDLSDMASNALDYAVELAKKANAKIILFHAYYIPTVVTDVSVVMPSIAEVEEGIKSDLEVLVNDVSRKLGDDSRVSFAFKQGFAKEEIQRYARECFVDLIVMGMQGAGFVDEHLFGSTSVAVMRSSPCLVLSIGPDTQFQEIKHIVLASDFETIDHPERVFLPFKELVKLLDAHVYILHIASDPAAIPSTDEAVFGVKLNHALNGVSHTFHQYQGNDVVEGINEFAVKYSIDIVTMIPHEHTFLHNLIHGSQTKRMAFHGKAPLLIIPI